MRKLIYLIFFYSTLAVGQQSAPGFEIACPPDSSFTKTAYFSTQRLASNTISTSRFSASYENVPDSIQIVVDEGLNIWSKILVSRIPIKVKVTWEELSSRVLAVTGSEKVYKNFENAPLNEIWYPSALANSISSTVNNQNSFDIILKINKNTQWNIKSNPGSNFRGYDLLSVVLHEIAHGVGFMSTFSENGSNKVKWGIENLPFIFDKFIVNQDDVNLVNNRFFTNDSQELRNIVTRENIYFKINDGLYNIQYPKLYTPAVFNDRGSLSHLSDQGMLPDSRDKLMYPGLSSGEQRHYPGESTLAILFQMGWEINDYPFSHNYPFPTDLNPITLYPNPANETVNLVLQEPDTNPGNEYKVIDEWGREINKGTFDNPEISIDISNLPTGKYFVNYKKFTNTFIKL